MFLRLKFVSFREAVIQNVNHATAFIMIDFR